MGVYIKGMEMPSDCDYCPLSNGFGHCNAKHEGILSYVGRDEDCPLIEVTEPHGRLIDADKLFGWYDGQRDEYPIKKETPQYGTLMMYEIFDEIDDAPTVIEAEGE